MQNLGQQREAATTIMNAGKAVPGIDNTPLGGKILSDIYHQTSQFIQDRYNFMNEYRAKNNGALVGADGAFAAQHQPQNYIAPVYARYGLDPDGGFANAQAVQNLVNKGYLTKADGVNIVRSHPEWKPGAVQGAQ